MFIPCFIISTITLNIMFKLTQKMVVQQQFHHPDQKGKPRNGTLFDLALLEGPDLPGNQQ